MSYKSHTISVIIPAFNEELSIAQVVEELRDLRDGSTHQTIVDDIIVCDNASTDRTAEFARQAGASVFHEFRQGYGFACLRGIEKLARPNLDTPDIVVFVDGDHSVNANELPDLLDAIIHGNDLVVGARTQALQEQYALSPHQRFGNAVASTLIRSIWSEKVTDLGPFRAIRYSSLMLLNMQDERFGWTVEMQVKALQAGMRYTEVPVSTLRRLGKSKISGTVRGTIGAFFGIFGKVFTLYLMQTRFQLSVRRAAAIRDSRS